MPIFYDFLLGADPEFYMRTNDGILASADIYEEHGTDFNGRLGRDGGGVLFEIRPTPSVDPFDLVKEIRLILSKIKKSRNSYFTNIKSLHADTIVKFDRYNNTVGGHIHFGYGNLIDNENFPYSLNENSIVEKLGNYLGILLYAIEYRSEKHARRRGEYGGMFDYRSKHYGMEYRAPSSWLISPLMTTVSLCLAKTVFFQILNQNNFSFIRECPKVNVYDSGAYYKQYDLYLRDNFDKIFESLSKMTLYPMYKSYLDIIPVLYKNDRSWYTEKNVDLYKSWSIL